MSKKNIKKKRGSRLKQKRLGPPLAASADRHALYEQSVQNTEAEFEFVEKVFNELRGRDPSSLREDFCGTAKMCCEWVRQQESNVAIGVDLDTEVLQWARDNNLSKLTKLQRERVTLMEGNVLSTDTDPVDVIMATNFSYQIFKDRDSLRGYFKRVYGELVGDGVLVMDVFGGSESQEEMEEKTKHKGFSYIWDQARYSPVTNEIMCYIHFRFPDGSKLEEAFSYDWRLWSVAELRELLQEAGFKRSTAYWEGADEDGDGNGIYEPTEIGEADPAWVSYVVAER